MQVEVITFGLISDITGQKSFHMQARDLDELKSLLLDQFPKLQDQHYAIAVNREFVTGNIEFPDHAEVALLPPFSGG